MSSTTTGTMRRQSRPQEPASKRARIHVPGYDPTYRSWRMDASAIDLLPGFIGGLLLALAGAFGLLTTIAGGMTFTEPVVAVGFLHATPALALLLVPIGLLAISRAVVSTRDSDGALAAGTILIGCSIVGMFMPAAASAFFGVAIAGLSFYLLLGMALLGAAVYRIRARPRG